MTPCPFCQGYLEAIEGTVYDPTPGEVEAARPEYGGAEILEYINGVEDAMKGSSFRLTLHHQNGAQCAVDVGMLAAGALRLRRQVAAVREEQTQQGPQTLMIGTPRRTMPTTPLRTSRRQQDIRETPLFGQDRAALERSQLTLDDGGSH